MVLDKTFYKNNTKLILQLTLVVLSLIIGFGVAFFTIKKSFFFLALIVGVLLLLICITDYKIGFIISVSAAFSVFIVSRYFMDSFPIGWIVESFIYTSFLGLVANCLIHGKSLATPLYHPISIFFVIYLLFILWQALNPSMYSIIGWFHFFRRQVMIFLIYILVVHFIESESDIKKLIKIWLIFAIASALYAIFTQLIMLPNFEDNWVLASKNRENLYYLVDGFKRKYSLYSDPAAFGMDMAATSLLLIILVFYSEKKQQIFLFIVLSMACLLGAIYSGTRTAYLMIFAGMLLFLLIKGINRTTLVLGLLSLLGLVGILKIPIYDNLFINRIRSAFYISQDASLQVRNVNRARIQPFIHDNPIGGGIYTTGGQGLEYNPGHILAGFPPDSGYLRAALETGWIGLIVILIFHFIILRSGIFCFFEQSNKSMRGIIAAVTACFFSFVVANYGQDAFGQIPSCFFFCICIGIIVKSKHLKNKVTP